MSQITDYEGTPITLGDIIVAVFDNCNIRKGIVLSATINTITVQWISCNKYYNLPDKPTKIFTHLHRFIKIGESVEPV